MFPLLTNMKCPLLLQLQLMQPLRMTKQVMKTCETCGLEQNSALSMCNLFMIKLNLTLFPCNRLKFLVSQHSPSPHKSCTYYYRFRASSQFIWEILRLKARISRKQLRLVLHCINTSTRLFDTVRLSPIAWFLVDKIHTLHKCKNLKAIV